MKKYTDKNILQDMNTIIHFLAKRDISKLNIQELENKYGIQQVDLLIILGSSIPDIALMGAYAYKSGLAREIMIVGGIGHSTKYLVQNVLNDQKYMDIPVDNKSEADILKQIIIKSYDIDEKEIIIENQSTNCGANAFEALRILKSLDKVPQSLIIIQDPTMQIRTHASFLKSWEGEKSLIISYSPFIPKLRETESGFEFINKDINGLWSIERFIDLIMGEIPRIRDDESGYGPKGKGFITHVDIPLNVLEAYERLKSEYSEYKDIKLRK